MCVDADESLGVLYQESFFGEIGAGNYRVAARRGQYIGLCPVLCRLGVPCSWSSYSPNSAALLCVQAWSVPTVSVGSGS